MELLVNVEHASNGSATYSVPHFPDPLTVGAEIINGAETNKYVMFEIKHSFKISAQMQMISLSQTIILYMLIMLFLL